jgi:hypothetical protein
MLTQHVLALDSDRKLARKMALESRIQAHKFSWDSSSTAFERIFFSKDFTQPDGQEIKS